MKNAIASLAQLGLLGFLQRKSSCNRQNTVITYVIVATSALQLLIRYDLTARPWEIHESDIIKRVRWP